MTAHRWTFQGTFLRYFPRESEGILDMNLLKNLMSNSKHWESLRCFRLGSVKLACLFLGVCLCLPWRFVCHRSVCFIFFMMFALMGLFLFFLLRAYVQRKWGRLLVESLVKCLLQNFSRIKMSVKEDVTSQARQEHLLFHPVWTSVSRYFVGMQSPYHVRSCFTACELQGACWKSRETFKCPRRCKLHDSHGILQDFEQDRKGPIVEVTNLTNSTIILSMTMSISSL